MIARETRVLGIVAWLVLEYSIGGLMIMALLLAFLVGLVQALGV